MAIESSRGNLDTAVLLAVVALACFALTGSAWFLAGTFAGVALMGQGAALGRTQRLLIAGLAVLFLVVVFGYTIGKDLALRDNAAADAVTQATGHPG